MEVSADIELPGEKKNIVRGALYLQDNLVKSDYGISKENFNYFVVSGLSACSGETQSVICLQNWSSGLSMA